MKKAIKETIGRDPGMGRVAFKTGVQLSRSQRMRRRTDKYARRDRDVSIKE